LLESIQPDIAITDRTTENCQNFVNINIIPQNVELPDLDALQRLLAEEAQRPQDPEFHRKEKRKTWFLGNQIRRIIERRGVK
jgi:hypothetical protein